MHEYIKNICVFAEKLKTARKNKGLTLKELGQIVDVSHASLSRLESGKSIPMRKTKIALAIALGDNFGEDWLDEHINSTEPAPPTPKEIADKMSVKDFVSLKFGGQTGRRSQAEIDALTTLLDAEIERIKKEQQGE